MYCGLRKEVTWRGWHALATEDASRLTMEDVERVRPEELREVIQRAEELTVEAVGKILAGDIAPRPADRNKCKWCDYQDVCRIETAERLVQVAVQ